MTTSSFRTPARLSIKRTAIISKINDAWAEEYAQSIANWLLKKGIAVTINAITSDLDLIIVLGGDGTLLHIAEQAARFSIPVTGINFGHLGFLTELTACEAEAALAKIFTETVTVEQRLMLKVRHIEHDKPSEYHYALNDIVINKNTTGRLLHLATHVGADYLTTYRADGLIFSTPTGSTAYNLSAGGPLVYPSSDTITVTPICPFMLSSRPIILPSNKIITTEFRGRDASECAQVIVDGQHSWIMTSGTLLEVQAAEHFLRLVVTTSRDFFTVIRNKLHWGGSGDQNKEVSETPFATED